jgi:2-polyprenyl-3-methyl-5-hydroxy-6-metoxy-1,4-benzoquinol methylase
MNETNQQSALDSLADRLERATGDVLAVQRLMDELTWELRGWRRRQCQDDWKGFVARARDHRLRGLVHQCPFTYWSFAKPRGYPGDASLLDFIYGEPEAADHVNAATELGRNIFARNRNVPSCRAVRFRKTLLAERLNSLGGASVLAVACGHLRELRQIAAGLSVNVTAFDQDPASLAEVRDQNRTGGVETIQGSIRQIVAGRFNRRDYDYIYAAGLYDYLGTPLAQRLTQVLMEKLSPGGSLLFANFTHDTEDVGYMEVYKDWWLIFRDEAEVLEIVRSVPSEHVSAYRLFRDPDRHILFAELQRR